MYCSTFYNGVDALVLLLRHPKGKKKFWILKPNSSQINCLTRQKLKKKLISPISRSQPRDISRQSSTSSPLISGKDKMLMVKKEEKDELLIVLGYK